MLLVKCPSCGRNQKYQPQQGFLSTKTKRCVYCGRSFKVHSNLEKSRIVAEI